MRLRKHTAFGRMIELDPKTGSWSEPAQTVTGLEFNGVADVAGDTYVALTREGDGLFVYLGSARFDVQDAHFHADYSEIGDGKSLFAVCDSKGAAELVYPSWWHSRPVHIGAESSPDEEQDVCAYIVYMIRGSAHRHLLLNRFIGAKVAAAPPELYVELPAATYFARIPASRSTPSTVYRFYDDKRLAPERYSPPHGWVADKDLYLRQMSGIITDEDRISETRARQIVRALGGQFAPTPSFMLEAASLPGESITGGYYASGPEPREEWHAGVKMRFVHWHYFRYYPNGDWISCFRPEPFDFWAFTDTVTPDLLAMAKRGKAPRIGDFDPLCSAGTYSIRAGVFIEIHEDYLVGQSRAIMRTIRDGQVFFGRPEDSMPAMVFVRRNGR